MPVDYTSQKNQARDDSSLSKHVETRGSRDELHSSDRIEAHADLIYDRRNLAGILSVSQFRVRTHQSPVADRFSMSIWELFSRKTDRADIYSPRS